MTYTPMTYTDSKNSVRVASTANLSVSSPGATIDGVTMAVGNRVLLKDQSTASENGIYIWNGAAVALTRALDADGAGELTTGASVFIEEGTANAGRLYFLTTPNPITVGSTSLTFTQFSSGASTLGALTDVTITAPADGQLLRYESTGSRWENAGSSLILLSDAGQLQVPTTGSGAGLVLGGDAQLYRGAADVITVAVGDKIQQNAAPTVADDLVNKTYADLKAPITSPTLTGTPSAPTAAADTDTTQISTTAFVQEAKAQAKLWSFVMA